MLFNRSVLGPGESAVTRQNSGPTGKPAYTSTVYAVLVFLCLYTVAGCAAPVFRDSGPTTQSVDDAAPPLGEAPTLALMTGAQDPLEPIIAVCAENTFNSNRRRWRFRDRAGALVAEVRATSSRVAHAICTPGERVAIRRETRPPAVNWSILRVDEASGARMVDRIVMVAGRNVSLPFEPVPGMRIEAGSGPEHIVASEVVARPNGCTQAWNHVALLLIGNDESLWARPGEEVIGRQGLSFEVHASAQPAGSSSERCLTAVRNAWSITRRGQ